MVAACVLDAPSMERRAIHRTRGTILQRSMAPGAKKVELLSSIPCWPNQTIKFTVLPVFILRIYGTTVCASASGFELARRGCTAPRAQASEQSRRDRLGRDRHFQAG
jgi:hypothetical protein